MGWLGFKGRQELFSFACRFTAQGDPSLPSAVPKQFCSVPSLLVHLGLQSLH